MSCWSRTLAALLFCGIARAHVVSISNGELRIAGTAATFELRMPAYEVESVASPEITLLDEIRVAGAVRTSSTCTRDGDWLTCRATYAFTSPPGEGLEVECTLFRVTVPNHIHMLYAVRGENSDQRVFDQNTTNIEMRFHPPSWVETLMRDSTAGALRLIKSPAAMLFLIVLALAGRSGREAIILSGGFLAAEWAARWVTPLIPLAMSPDFLEAVLALTAAYLAGELLLLPGGSGRRIVTPILGLIHGMPFAAFPPLYLAGVSAVQVVSLTALGLAVRRLPDAWLKPSSGIVLTLAAAWFLRLVLGT